jgi:hypothetical protein
MFNGRPQASDIGRTAKVWVNQGCDMFMTLIDQKLDYHKVALFDGLYQKIFNLVIIKVMMLKQIFQDREITRFNGLLCDQKKVTTRQGSGPDQFMKPRKLEGPNKVITLGSLLLIHRKYIPSQSLCLFYVFMLGRRLDGIIIAKGAYKIIIFLLKGQGDTSCLSWSGIIILKGPC